MYEVLAAPLVDGPIKFETSRAARYILPTSILPPANTTPVLRDVRRAIKIFSYTVHGAFFLIFQKEWGVHPSGRSCLNNTDFFANKENGAQSLTFLLDRNILFLTF